MGILEVIRIRITKFFERFFNIARWAAHHKHFPQLGSYRWKRDRIFMKILSEMYFWTRNFQLNFSSHLYSDLNRIRNRNKTESVWAEIGLCSPSVLVFEKELLPPVNYLMAWWRYDCFTISQLRNLCTGTPRICNFYYVGAFCYQDIPSMKFAEDKVLTFLIIREKC